MNGTTNIRRSYRAFGHYFVETTHNKYVFGPVSADRIRGGSKGGVEGLFVYVGETTVNNYPNESSLEEVPDAVLDTLPDAATVIEGIESGWANWDGRPEWSESYVDVSDAQVVDR